MANVLKVGLVGAGKFAGYHAQKIQASKIAEFIGIFDVRHARAKTLCEQHKVASYATVDALAANCDAVIIACPASLHYAVAEALLERGCHLLVEKPLALSGKLANKLVSLTEKKALVLQVGHQERIVCQAFGLFDINDKPVSVDIVRANCPPEKGRAMDVNVIWDLMIHDLDLVHAMLGDTFEDMACEAAPHLGSEYDEATASFHVGQTRVNIRASRIAEKPDRRMELVYASGSIRIDFLTRKLENTTPYKLVTDLSGQVADPLMEADEMFFKACLGDGVPLVTGREGARAVATAETLTEYAMQSETELLD